MRKLDKIDEFQREASNALFTRSQAVAVTLRLLEMEMNSCDSAEEAEVLANAMRIAHVGYLDATSTEIDTLLDSMGVARITAEDIVKAINAIVFDAE